MLKSVVFLLFFLPSVFGFTAYDEPASCDCPNVTDLQKTGQTSSSISFSWTRVDAANQYKVWYYRHEGQYTSGYFYTSGTSFDFTNLDAGNYIFNVVAVCGSEGSNIVGIEDVIQG